MAAETPTPDIYGEAAASGGLPQFDFSTWASQIFWLLLVFWALYFLLATFILPRIGRNIAERTDRINDDLDQAAASQAQAEDAEKTYRTTLADARAKAMTVSEATRQSIDADVAKEIEAADLLADREADAAETRIRKIKTSALENIESVAADVAGEVVTALTGKTLDAAALRAALTQTGGSVS